jgi:hypothetical protein
MNQRRRNLLFRIGLGLGVGAVVPLAVVVTLLVTTGDNGGTTVRIAPSAQFTETPRGLQVRRGKDVERFLLTARDLGPGWTVFSQGQGAKSGLSLDKAVSVVPEIPKDCSAFVAVQAQAFETPWARTVLFNTKARQSLVETIYVFRPGMAQETLAYLRGLIARCGTYDQQLTVGSSKGTTHVTTTVSAAPRLGDESLRIATRFKYSGRFTGTSRNDGIYVRLGDTVLHCSGNPAGLDGFTSKALAKLT